jgi:hypothetical protein
MLKLLKVVRKILHPIVILEISILLGILYIFIIIPFSLIQKLSRMNKKMRTISSNWVKFREDYSTIDDLNTEG